MKTKEKVLEILSNNVDRYISGQEIADSIYVTRASVWKAIKQLQDSGYDIDAITNKGYMLHVQPDRIDAAIIKSSLAFAGIDMDVTVYDEVTSTNDIALELAKVNSDNAVIIANSQTKGRGRRGRTFYSPENTGLYMSVLVRADDNKKNIGKITAIAAVSAAQAIDEVVFAGVNTTSIKWVNDIYINNKKVAGILTERFSSMEEGSMTYIVVGFGLNIFLPVNDFPVELRKIAGSIVASYDADSANIRNEIASRIITKLMHYFESDQDDISRKCLEDYISKSFLIGSYVKIDSFDGSINYAYVEGIDDDYHLIVKYDDGHTSDISSGEVSVVKY